MLLNVSLSGGTPLINTEEAAKQLFVTPYTIRKYIRRGILSAVRVGKSYLIDEHELARLLQTYRTPAQGGQHAQCP